MWFFIPWSCTFCSMCAWHIFSRSLSLPHSLYLSVFFCVCLCLFSLTVLLPLSLFLSFVLPCVSLFLPFLPLVLSHTFVPSPSLCDFLFPSLSHAHTRIYWYPSVNNKKRCNACTICQWPNVQVLLTIVTKRVAVTKRAARGATEQKLVRIYTKRNITHQTA